MRFWKVAKRGRKETAMRFWSAVLIVAVCSVSGCGESSVEPLARDDATITLGSGTIFDVQSLQGDSAIVNTEGKCDAGGTRKMSGIVRGSSAGNVRTITFALQSAMIGCAMRAATGQLITVDGLINMTGETRAQLSGANQPPMILSATSRQQGTSTTTFDGQTTTCQIDVVQTYDSVTKKSRLTGTSCGRAVDLVVPAPR